MISSKGSLFCTIYKPGNEYHEGFDGDVERVIAIDRYVVRGDGKPVFWSLELGKPAELVDTSRRL
jgi:hypothetical protein